MTNPAFEAPESVGTFGSSFNYQNWTAGTQISVCNVPWNQDYRDVVRFGSQTKLDEYIDRRTAKQWQWDTVSFIRPGHPIRLDVPYNQIMFSNYIRVRNPIQPTVHVMGDGLAYPDVEQTYYYFITGAQYVAPNVTLIMVQLDVFQTYGYRIQPGMSYVERGHVGIANRDDFKDFGKANLTVPEGLDLGSEYDITHTYSQNIADGGGENYDVIVWATTDLHAAPGTVEKPNLVTATGSDWYGLPNGAMAYYFDSPARFQAYLTEKKDYPWILQGIISVMVMPNLNRYTQALPAGAGSPLNTNHSPRQKLTAMAGKWRDKLPIPARYKHLNKFKVYPYCVLELTSNSGNPLLLKPEQWDQDARVMELPYLALPAPRVTFYPYRYNAHHQAEASGDNRAVLPDGGEHLDMTTGITNFPMFSIVNNSYISYLASNANSIAYQHQSADWSQQKAMTGNQLSYDQASQNIATSQQMTGISTSAASQSTALSNSVTGTKAVIGAGSGLVGGILSRNPIGMAGAVGGAVTTGANAAVDIGAANAQLGISNNAAFASNRAQTQNMGYMRDTNKTYADFAARGDYANQIAAINARVQDAKLIQPTTSGQVGGDAFNLAMYKWGYDLKVKLVNSGVMKLIGEYWLRFGYSINRFMKPPSDFKVMTKFSYWKFQEFYITSGNVPEDFKQSLRGIFEKGVTVWSNPDDIGNIDVADNEPIKGAWY